MLSLSSSLCVLCGGDKGLVQDIKDHHLDDGGATPTVVGELRVIRTPYNSLSVNYQCPSCSKRVEEVFTSEGEMRGMKQILEGTMKDLISKIKELKNGTLRTAGLDHVDLLEENYVPLSSSLSSSPTENFLKVTGGLEQAILQTQQVMDRWIQSEVNRADKQLLGFLRSLMAQIIKVGSVIPEVTRRMVKVKVEEEDEYLQNQGVLIKNSENEDEATISSPYIHPFMEDELKGKVQVKVKEEQTDSDADMELGRGDYVEDFEFNVSDDEKANKVLAPEDEEDFEEPEQDDDKDDDYIPTKDEYRGGDRGPTWSYRKYKCSMCKRGYRAKARYLTHMSSLGHREKVKEVEGLEELPAPAVQFICETCGKVHYSSGSLNLHILSAHQIEGNPEICPQCGKGFKLQRNLQQHIARSHSGLKYACDICDKTYPTTHDRKNHIARAHNGVTPSGHKPKKCPHCNKTFKAQLLRHHMERFHHPKGPEGYLMCSHCDEKCPTLKAKKIHERSVHKGLELFTCEECGKVYPDKCHLNKHLLRHTKVKDFQCEKCGDKFPRSDALKNHCRLNMCENPRVVKRRLNKIKKQQAEATATQVTPTPTNEEVMDAAAAGVQEYMRWGWDPNNFGRRQ